LCTNLKRNHQQEDGKKSFHSCGIGR
jgi:hypothetical protein